MEAAVLDLLSGLPEGFWPDPCKRVRDWQEQGKPLSGNTGAYNQARQAIPVSMVQQSCDRIFAELTARMSLPGPESTPAVFILDGTSMRLAHRPSLLNRFPAGSSRYGNSHWPVLRMVVAHDLHTGLAMRPEWGPMYGPCAVSEQKLIQTAISRLPAGSTLMGDANFGVFSVAFAGVESGRSVLLRMTTARAKRLAGEELRDGIDREVIWKPSRGDRQTNPDLPASAAIIGRLVVTSVRPSNGNEPFLLAIFTTLAAAPQQLLHLYGQRWAVETDLRTLKNELHLDQLTCSTPDMVAKEIEMCIAAYNLVRAVICLAAKQSGLAPRAYGFTRVRRIIQSFASKIANTTTPDAAQKEFDRMMYYVLQAKLPQRTRPPYPRGTWSKGFKFANRSPNT